MPDLIIAIPNHGFAIGATVFVSWLNAVFFVRDTDIDGVAQAIDANSFKISTDDSDNNIVEFVETITDGFVRLDEVSAGVTITGLSHLEGELVHVVSGGVFIGAFTVASSQITVPDALTVYQVGLLYSAKIRTMRLEVPAAPTTQSRIKRINETVIRALRTEGGKAGTEYGGREYLTDLAFTYSNESEDVTVSDESGFTPDAYTVFRSDTPFPATVLANIVSFEIEEQR